MARKAKASTVKEDEARKNTTPEERFDEHFPIISAAKHDLEAAQKAVSSANSVYRNALKSYKKAGGDTDALIEALRLQKMEPADVDKLIAGVNWHLRALGVPVGQQLGLFPDGETVATKVDTDKIAEQGDGAFDTGPLSTEATIRKAKDQGYSDGIEGKTAFNVYADGSPEALAYTGSWTDGQAKLAERLGEPPASKGGEDEPTPRKRRSPAAAHA